MPAFHRRDLAVRAEPAGLDPLRAYCNFAQAMFDPRLLREWERAVQQAFGAGFGGVPFVQLLELNHELRRRAELRRDDAQRAIRQMLEAASARAERRVVAHRQRARTRARTSRRSVRVRAMRARDDVRALLGTMRELSFRVLEASLIWPFTDDERARWLAFWQRLVRRGAAKAPEPDARFDVFVKPDPYPRAVRVAAARRLHAALLEALRMLRHAEPRLTAQTSEQN